MRQESKLCSIFMDILPSPFYLLPFTFYLLFFSFFFSLSSFAFAQTGISLETEIQNIERSINRQGVSASERHAGLVRLATLRQLSGDIEGAARNWYDAARAFSDRVDDDALLNCAFCLAAMGEWERAQIAVEPLLAKSERARFLNTSINAIKAKNTSQLAVLADSPAFESMRSEILFLLWKLSADTEAERWKQRLISEFPLSPEALIANGGDLGEGQSVMLRTSPFWLFLTMNDEQLAISREQGTGNREQGTGSREQVPTPSVPSVPSTRLQTGIYSQQANAQTQAEKLRQAGFNPTIEERQIGENKMWAVTVPANQEQALKAAGIEYFVLR